MTTRAPRIASAAILLTLTLALAACVSGGTSPTTTSTPVPGQPKGGAIEGTWNVSTVNGAQVPGGKNQVTADFKAGTVSGFGGVNNYSGPYTADTAGAFKAGPIGATQMAGPPEAQQLEKGYLDALQKATSYYSTGTTLTLYSSAGAPIVVYDKAQ